MLALLFFVTVTMVIAVMLSAATTAAGNIESDRRQQQHYLSVNSVAVWMRDEIGEGIIKLKYDEESYAYDVITEEAFGSSSIYEDSLFPEGENNLLGHADSGARLCDFAPLMKNAVDTVASGGKADYTFTLSVNNADLSLQNIHVHFTMDEHYDIKVLYTLMEEDRIVYLTTLTLLADEYDTALNFGSGSEPVMHDVKVLSWTESKMMKGDVAE